jgi:catecholate siderophore receptor
MKSKQKHHAKGKKSRGCWPVTYRMVAMGTLVAYTAFGASKVVLAHPKEEFGKAREAASDQQALVVRRFEIAEGSLQETLGAFEKATEIHVTFSEDGIKSLHSAGVSGLYTPEQALKVLLGESGATFYFTTPGAVTVRLKSVATSVEVSAEMLEMLPSPKYTELLQDTPQTISVVSQEIMQQQGANTLRDALRNVAGISLAAGEGGAQGDNLTIRGFSARNDLFLDGMRDFGSYFRDTFNFQSVDVIQGPTSVTFGRGSTGGIVNQESKTAVAARFISGDAEFGSDLTRRVTADINEPIGKNSAFRLNVMGNDSQVAERDIAENRRFGVAPSLAFGLGTPTRVVVNYLHQSEYNTPDYGIPWLYNGPAPVDRSNYYGFRHGNYLNTSVDIGTVRVEHDFGSAISLRYQGRFGHYDRSVQVTEARVIGAPPVGTPLDEIMVSRNQIAVSSLETSFDNQIDATFRFRTGFAKHALVAGIEIGRETSSPDRYAWSGVPSTSLTDPDEDQPFAGTRNITSHVNTLANSFGMYVVDTVELGRKWNLVGGLRWDRFDTDYNSLTYAYNPNTVTPVQFDRLDEKPSYRAAVVFKPKPYGSVYFSYGTSFNPSAESLSLSASTANLPPEDNQTYEVGTKWDFPSRRLSVESSIFQTTKLNAREPDPNNPLLNVLAGTQRVRGFEVAVTGGITDRWQMLSSYAYLDGKLASSEFYPQYVGYQLANVPRNTFNMWTTYALPWKFTVGAGTQFVDSRTASTTAPLDPTTGLVKTIPSYWVFNAMGSHPLGEHMNLQLNLYNLANRYYFDQPHPGHIIPGAGFTALGGINFRY